MHVWFISGLIAYKSREYFPNSAFCEIQKKTEEHDDVSIKQRKLSIGKKIK